MYRCDHDGRKEKRQTDAFDYLSLSVCARNQPSRRQSSNSSFWRDSLQRKQRSDCVECNWIIQWSNKATSISIAKIQWWPVLNCVASPCCDQMIHGARWWRIPNDPRLLIGRKTAEFMIFTLPVKQITHSMTSIASSDKQREKQPARHLPFTA